MDVNELAVDVVAGLRGEPRSIPCKYFYDHAGSLLFEEICALPEYYLTRAEHALLERHAAELAKEIGPRATVIELGSGSSTKTRLLLDALESPKRYVPIDISAEHLHDAADGLRARYPRLEVTPIVADYTKPLPPLEADAVFFPGSSIGNFSPDEAVALLARAATMSRLVIVGVDVPKDRATIEAAYNDAAGVTARFNRNVLVRIARELAADVDPEAFAHEARWDPDHHRVEMRLVSRAAQTIRVAGVTFAFARGEAIVTEHCHKWSPEVFAALAARAGLTSERVLFDEERRVSMHLLRRRYST